MTCTSRVREDGVTGFDPSLRCRLGCFRIELAAGFLGLDYAGILELTGFCVAEMPYFAATLMRGWCQISTGSQFAGHSNLCLGWSVGLDGFVHHADTDKLTFEEKD